MVVCAYVLALRQTGNLSRLYPGSYPVDRLQIPHDPELDKGKKM